MEMILEKSQLERIATHVEGILDLLDDAPGREGLKKTPLRVARALCNFTRGSQRSWNEIADGAVFDSSMDGMILVRDIELFSLCEHHLLPFVGHCHIAYIPNGKLIGLSRIPDIVAFYARRLQLQETLTRQIAEALMKLLDARGVAIIIEAKHLCVMMNSTEKQRASLTTSVMLGLFSDHPPTRSEFLNLLSRHTEGSKLI